MESIHGFVIKDDHLFFWVTGSGFTSSEDFELNVEIGIAGNMVTLKRIKQDFGRMKKHVKRVVLDKPSSLGMEEFQLKNPFQPQFWLSTSETSIETESTNTENNP